MGRVNYWTRELVLKRLRRALREVFDNDPSQLSTNAYQYQTRIRPFNESYGQNRPLYPSFSAICRTVGGLQKAWKALGYDVQVKMLAKAGKYKFTDEIDARICEMYSHPNAKLNKNFQGGIPGVKAYAAEIGWPHWVICKRAVELGVSRIKEKPWNQEELNTLDELAHYCPHVIAQKFKEHGFRRTAASVGVMRNKRWAHKGAPWYSGHALATLMGVDAHQVDRVWVPLGLTFTLKGTERGKRNKKQGGDTRLFYRDEIRRFLIEHPEEIDLLKVDKMWFLEIVTQGDIRMLAPSERLSLRFEAPRPGMKSRHTKTKAAA